MKEKRYEFHQKGNFHTVVDNIEKKPLIVMEFKENEFGKYACFHRIIDLMNEFYEENELLKEENNRLHNKIFEIRTIQALERIKTSKQKGKLAKDFLEEMDNW